MTLLGTLMVPPPPSVLSLVMAPRSSRRPWRLTRLAPPTALAEPLSVNPPPSPPAPSGVTMTTLPLTLMLPPTSASLRRETATCPRATTGPPSRMGRLWPFPPAAPLPRVLTCLLLARRQTAKPLTSLRAFLHPPPPLPLVDLSSATFLPLLLLPTAPSSPPELPSPPPSTRTRRPPCSTRSTTTGTCQLRPAPSAESSRSRMPPSPSNFASPPPGPS